MCVFGEAENSEKPNLSHVPGSMAYYPGEKTVGIHVHTETKYVNRHKFVLTDT
ncbi:hypothetical protein DPMN_171226 [Dreissena polymorpha]|uniref:Uncharacterized protein n=1 Tax=Dreissena polymorpha TaxID=45954 RepID=A0A9D4DXL7_DREPO|nr:hypothetical protein DPMN_171226 [Dreissena polymorpha]